MGETNAEQPIQDIELQAAIKESAEAVISYLDDEVQKRSTELAVREHFGGLESAETVRRANSLYMEFVVERGYDPRPALVAAVGKSMVYFPDAETTGVIMLNELFDSGDLGQNEEPSKEDLDTIGHYLLETDKYSLSETDVKAISDALGIPKNIRGLELIHTLAGMFDDGEVTAHTLFDLGIIDAATYDEIIEAEEADESSTETMEREDEVEGSEALSDEVYFDEENGEEDTEDVDIL